MTGLDLVPTSKFIVFQRASLLVGGRGCHPQKWGPTHEKGSYLSKLDERPGMIPIDQSRPASCRSAPSFSPVMARGKIA